MTAALIIGGVVYAGGVAGLLVIAWTRLPRIGAEREVEIKTARKKDLRTS